MNFQLIASVISGSRAYGTNIKGSDWDIHGVHLPCAQDILLQNVKESVGLESHDAKSKPLHTFLNFLSEGNPEALEVIFTPRNLYQMPADSLWINLVEEIFANKSLLPDSTSFLRYSQKQSGSFANKSIRIGSLEGLMEVLAKHGDLKLKDIREELMQLNLAGITLRLKDQGYDQEFLLIGSKQISFGKTVGEALKFTEQLYSRYGARSLRANESGGTDWKALMHALRISEEGVEYHSTKNIELPRPNASYLKLIRLGEVDLDKVRDDIYASQEQLSDVLQAQTVNEETYLPLFNEWKERKIIDAYSGVVENYLSTQTFSP